MRIAPLMAALSVEERIAWVLLPHNIRPFSGDLALLETLEDALRERDGALVWSCKDPPTSNDMKGVVEFCDGVVTGRMHLAIAALGRRVPVLCMTYKDKFEGLLDHFGLPDETWIDRVHECSAEELSSRIEAFTRRLVYYRTMITARLPAIRRLAEENFHGAHADEAAAGAALMRAC